jgi:hypothetical protein
LSFLVGADLAIRRLRERESAQRPQEGTEKVQAYLSNLIGDLEVGKDMLEALRNDGLVVLSQFELDVLRSGLRLLQVSRKSAHVSTSLADGGEAKVMRRQTDLTSRLLRWPVERRRLVDGGALALRFLLKALELSSRLV